LTGFVVLRSACYLGLVAFMPLYAIGVLHQPPQIGAALDSTYLICGIAGTIAGGPLADRFGRRAILIGSTSSAATLVAIFIAFSHGGSAPIGLDFVFAALIGFTLVASQTSFIVLGQEYLPNRIGIATGVTMGLAVSVGGMFSPIFGRIGDAYGLAASVWTIVGLTFAALCFAFTLPPHARRLAYASSGKPSPASAS